MWVGRYPGSGNLSFWRLFVWRSTWVTSAALVLGAFGVSISAEHFSPAHVVVAVSATGGIAGATGDGFILLVHRQSSMKTSGPLLYVVPENEASSSIS